MQTNSNKNISRLKYLIAQNENDKVFEELLRFIIQNNSLKKFEHELIILQSNYNDFEQKIRLGLDAPPQLKNSIIHRTLELIERIEKENDSILVDAYEDYFNHAKEKTNKKNLRLVFEVSGSAVAFTCVLIFAPGILYAIGALILIAVFFIGKSYTEE